MKKVVSFEKARLFDEYLTEKLSIPSLILMEDVAIAMVDFIKKQNDFTKEKVSVAAICGSGNNAGDAVAICRILWFKFGIKSTIIKANIKTGKFLAEQLVLAENIGLSILSWTENKKACKEKMFKADILIDGLIGTGFTKAITSEIEQILDELKESPGSIYSIDVPSGLNEKGPGSAVRADFTLCIEPVKEALYYPVWRPFCGQIIPIPDICPPIRESTNLENIDEYPYPICNELLDESDLISVLKPVKFDVHKYDRGSVAILAGNEGTTGAAIMTAKSAQSNTGLVTLFVRPEILPSCAAQLTEPLVKSESQLTDLKKFSAICAGPGWGMDKTRETLFRFIWESDLPLILDADAIKIMKTVNPGRRKRTFIITPHIGELAELTDTSKQDVENNPFTSARQVALKYGCIVVLKSCVTWIVGEQGPAGVFDGMTPSLAFGGSGDILTGIMASFLADGSSPANAARAAVITHGIAGKRISSLPGLNPAENLIDETSILLVENRKKSGYFR